jgi:WD40 repeat protein
LELTSFPTAALAHVTASLEVFDTEEARRLAVEALWKGPTAFVLPVGPRDSDVWNLAFSPDGRILAAAASVTDEVFVWSDTGDLLRVLGERGRISAANTTGFSESGDILFLEGSCVFRLWAVPGFELIREFAVTEGSDYDDSELVGCWVMGDRILRIDSIDGQFPLRLSPLLGGPATDLGAWQKGEAADWAIDPTNSYLLFARGHDIYQRPLDALESAEPDRLVGRHSGDVSWISSPKPLGVLAAADVTGKTHLWSMDPNPANPLRTLRGTAQKPLYLSPDATHLVDFGAETGSARPGYRLWDLTGPPDARPVLLWEPPGSSIDWTALDPRRRWLAGTAGDKILLWPLARHSPYVFEGHTGTVNALAFTSHGEELVTASLGDQTVRVWPLSPANGEESRVIWEHRGISSLAPDPSGRYLLVSLLTSIGGPFLVSVSGIESAATNLWPDESSGVHAVTFSDDGRSAAAAVLAGYRWEEMQIRVWDLESGDVQVLALCDQCAGEKPGLWQGGVWRLRFTPEGDLLSAGAGGVRRWDLETGRAEWLIRVDDAKYLRGDFSQDARFVLAAEATNVRASEALNLTLHDLKSGASHRIVSHGDVVNKLAIDATGTIIATSTKNVIRVGSADGSAPYLLFGHEGDVVSLAVSPDGRWIASGAEDFKIRLWPMPDLSKPPLHTLPREELIAKLKTLTNLRVVRDPDSPTGWKLTHDPFPGWETVPTW